MNTKKTSSSTKRKIAAIAAGALVVGIGATYTLASWTDSEWVWGGASGDPGVGTSSFNVQQDTTSPFASPGTFRDFETNAGDELTFSAGSLALTPGDTIYAPVALQTAATSIAGEVELQGAVAAAGTSTAAVDANGDLWRNVKVSVYTASGSTPPSACTTSFVSTGWTQIVTNASLATVASAKQPLSASAGSTQHYCFALTLNTTLEEGSTATDISQLQGRTIAPAWEFEAESN